MPGRPQYRDPISGRFISEERARELGQVTEITVTDEGERVETPVTFDIGTGDLLPTPPEEEAPQPNWDQVESKWGFSWATEGDTFLDMDALAVAEFPEDATSFRVFFDVEVDANYKNGIASTKTLDADEWPPSLDMLRGVSPNGIKFIAFSAQ